MSKKQESKKKHPSVPPQRHPNTPPQYAAKKVQSFENQDFTPIFFIDFFKKNITFLSILIILSFALYLRGINYDYVLDDKIVITQNEFTQRGADGIGDIFRYESFRGFFKEKKDYLEGDRYRPFSIATFAIERTIFGKDNKTVSHFFNIFLYALTSILIFRVILQCFSNNSIKKNIQNIENQNNSLLTEGGVRWLAFATALLFVAHPLHVEVVANIKGRDEIFAFLGEFSAWWAAFCFLDTRKIQYLFISFLTFCIGIFSKESTITFVLVIPLAAWWFRRASWGDLARIVAPLVAATVVYLVARSMALGTLFPAKQAVCDIMNDPFCNLSFAQKMATIFLTLGWYLKLLFVPYPLTHDYYPYHVPIVTWSDVRAWGSLVGLVGVKLWALWQLWRSRHTQTIPSLIAFAVLFFLITMTIVSNIFVPIGTFMNERFAYHASFGFCLALSYFLISQKFLSNYKWIILSGIAFLFSVQSFSRVADWKDENTLNKSAITVSHQSARANLFYGISMWQNDYMSRREKLSPTEKRLLLDKMKPYFLRALEINPQYNSAYRMWAGWLGENYGLDKNLDFLLQEFERINRGQLANSDEPFVIQYLEYLNKSTMIAEDRQKLTIFAEKMLQFYTQRNDIAKQDFYKKILGR